jgi:peptidyl-prolyl cis-trans isomerase A (cyclophilin A)
MRTLAALLLASVGTATADYTVSFQTDVAAGSPPGLVVINVTSAWAPLGAAHLQKLVADHFYDGAAFFRVVPNFVVQFGIAGTPAENAKWNTPIADDPVLHSNLEGTIVYATAGPNTRTTQLFINLKDNKNLDTGFAPFGTVVQGMDVVRAIYNPTPGSSSGVSQPEYESGGDAWIRQQYPKINFITKATVAEVVEE